MSANERHLTIAKQIVKSAREQRNQAIKTIAEEDKRLRWDTAEKLTKARFDIDYASHFIRCFNKGSRSVELYKESLTRKLLDNQLRGGSSSAMFNAIEAIERDVISYMLRTLFTYEK